MPAPSSASQQHQWQERDQILEQMHAFEGQGYVTTTIAQSPGKAVS